MIVVSIADDGLDFSFHFQNAAKDFSFHFVVRQGQHDRSTSSFPGSGKDPGFQYKFQYKRRFVSEFSVENAGIMWNYP